MKTVITLDPEYIPWEPGNPTVRLRRKRNKTLAAILVVVAMVFLFGGGLFMSSQNKPGTPAALEAAPVPTAPATWAVVPTPALITRAQPGRLAVIDGNTASFFPCGVYGVRSGETVIATGDATDGVIVDVTGYEGVTIECENQIVELH